jgi:hypothetical protein
MAATAAAQERMTNLEYRGIPEKEELGWIDWRLTRLVISLQVVWLSLWHRLS